MPKKMYVVFCENDGTYWCGLNTWDKQLRKAQVFHSLKYANDVHHRFKQLKLKNVEIRMELVTENPTNADRIRAMSDEELAAALAILTELDLCVNPSAREDECDCCPFAAFCSDCVKGRELEWLQQPAERDNGGTNNGNEQ